MGDEGVGNIFIPKECIGREGYLIGYNSLGFEICIIDIFPFHIPISKIHNLLLDTPFVGLKEYLNEDLRILGDLGESTSAILNPNEDIPTHKDLITDYRNTADIWITLSFTHKQQITLRSLTCCGYKYNVNANIVIFDPLEEMYFCYTPPKFEEVLKFGKLKEKKKIPKSKDIIYPSTYIPFLKYKEPQLSTILTQINLRNVICKFFRFLVDNLDSDKSRNSLLLAQFGRKPKGISFSYLVIQKIISIFAILFNMIIYPIFIIFKIKIPFVSGKCLIDISYLGQLLERKINKINSWSQYIQEIFIEIRRNNSQTTLSHVYLQSKIRIKLLEMNLFNSIFQFIGDILLGISCFYLVNIYSEEILTIIHSLQFLHLKELRGNIDWLLGIPSGFKPNKEFNQFIGTIILAIFHYWNYFTTLATLLEPYILSGIGISALLGLTVLISFSQDILSICTLHIQIIYQTLRKGYRITLSFMSTLILLFRGKKINIIKGKKVTSIFDIEEMILGILVETLLLFLLPTLSMYYFTFALITLGILIFNVCLASLYCIVSDFPGYLLLKRNISKDNIVANGIRLYIEGGLLSLACKPYPIGALFFKFGKNIKKIVIEMLNPKHLLQNMLSGKSIISNPRNL